METTNERELSQLVGEVKSNPLNPEGWQALGKALGWRKDNRDWECPIVTCDGNVLQTDWQYHALRYFELKLTNGNCDICRHNSLSDHGNFITHDEDKWEEKFWEELLNA